MAIFELSNFYDERFQQCFRAYFQEIGVNLKEDTDVFDVITESYEKENMRTFVIGEDGQFAGFIMLQPEHLQGSFFAQQAGFIRELWAAPPFRKLGYGRHLLKTAEAYFREKNISMLILTYDENALGFYEKMGFSPDNTYTAKNDGKVVVKHI